MSAIKRIGVTSTTLHILAMIFMLIDHVGMMFFKEIIYFRWIGRLAMPIFTFMLVEGYFHTKNLKKYVTRLFLFALLSEIPFNLLVSNKILYPNMQNIIWSFLISIGLIHINEKIKEKENENEKKEIRQTNTKGNKTVNKIVKVGVVIETIFLAVILGILTNVDYHFAGILMVLTFYYFREKKWYNYIMQFVTITLISMFLVGGSSFTFNLLGYNIELKTQIFAIFALLFIYLYNGKQGYHNKIIKYSFYLFYPIHMIILVILNRLGV